MAPLTVRWIVVSEAIYGTIFSVDFSMLGLACAGRYRVGRWVLSVPPGDRGIGEGERGRCCVHFH